MNASVRNYDEFKELFIREDGKRKNKIILDMFKDRDFMRYIMSHPTYRALTRVRTMADLFALCDYFIADSSRGCYEHSLLGNLYRSNIYSEDGKGVCLDGDFRGYRYYNNERQQVFKMKIGKMYKHFCEMSDFGRHLPESIILYLCEEITQRWMTHTRSRVTDFELHVDDDFEKIYSSDFCVGDFCSCMTDDDNYHFYEESVNAKAAYLTNREGGIVARCVIFLDAVDSNGKRWRLAERQYSSDGDEVYKRLLVHALIKGGHIDGYKKVGAGCHDPRLWMDINDARIENARFSIPCKLEPGDYISYQDSFKWFDHDAQIAFNYEADNAREDLSTTDLHYEGSNYDEWHEDYTSDELTTVFSGGDRYMCSENRLEDFRFVDSLGQWHHEDDVICCDYCGEYRLNENAVYSDITGDWYCCDECREAAEKDAAGE